MSSNINGLKRRIAELEKQVQVTKSGEETTKREKKQKSFIPLQVLYSWSAPERVFVQRDKPWFLKISAVALFFILVAAFLQDFFIILVICIFVLVVFLLASIPPQKIEHGITNKGIRSFDVLYKWGDLKEFWITKKFGQKVVNVNTKMKFPARLIMLIHKAEEKTIVKLLGDRLDYIAIEEKKGWLSKISDGEVIDPSMYEGLFKRKKKVTSEKSQSKTVTREPVKQLK